MKAAGLDPETFRAASQAQGPLLLHPENVVALDILAALDTQWRTETLSTMAQAVFRYVGLDYSAIEPTARLLGHELTRSDFLKLRRAEKTAIEMRNRR